MKRIIFVLAFISFSFVGFSEYQLQKGLDGSFRAKPAEDTVYRDLNIFFADSVVLKFTDIFDSAISNPGDTIFANLSGKFIEMEDVFFERRLMTEEGIVFDKNTNLLSYATKNSSISFFSIMIIIAFISMFFMTIFSVRWFFCKEFGNFDTFLSIIAFLAAVIVIGLAADEAIIASFFFFVAATSIVVAAENKKRCYIIIATMIYYIAFITGLILLYLQ